MTVEIVKGIAGEALKAILLAAGPALIVALAVGLVVSFFQAITQLQEFTLTFVPKILAVFLCLFVSLPWMTRVLTSFAMTLIENIPVYIR
jgi:flagellar biosynthetic protein FliQ